MKPFLAVITVLLSAGNCLAATQPLSPAPPDRAQILNAARDVMKQAHFATLITVSEDAQPQARIVDPSEPDSDFTVWTGTNPLTRKVAQLRKNPRTIEIVSGPHKLRNDTHTWRPVVLELK